MKITNEIKVGALATGALLVLIIGYNFLKGGDLFSNDDELYANYERVNGLSVSKPVLINGYPIGKVSELTLLPNGKILAKLKIHRGYKIPKNTIANLAGTNLLGEKAIILILGNSNEFTQNGDTLQGSVQKNILEQVEPIQQKATQIISHLDSILYAINSSISASFHHDFERSFKSIAKTLENLEKISVKVDDLVGTQAIKFKHILENAESISENFKNNNEKISSIASNLAQTLAQTNKAITSLELILNKINTGGGSLGQLVNDKKLYSNLSAAAENLDKLMIDLKANPKRYIHLSIFGSSEKTSARK